MIVDAVLKLVRAATQLDIVRADIKADQLPPHHFMHLRVLDENGRQLGQGRSLAVLKAELGSQARGAFQALAALKSAHASLHTDWAADRNARQHGGRRGEVGDPEALDHIERQIENLAHLAHRAASAMIERTGRRASASSPSWRVR